MNKNLLTLAGLAAFAIATPSFAADLTIRIAGSTAMRSNVNSALTTLGYTVVAQSNASATSASYHIYSKGTSPDKITVKTSYGGSVGGVKAVATGQTDLPYLPGDTTGTVASSVAVSENAAADLAFSDCWQNATIFNTPVLSDTICGVVQFRWVTNNGSPITNITPQQIRVLYQNGTIPLSAFTGSSADESKLVYAFGRDPDSGTRVTAFAENGLGTNPTVFQYKAAFSGSALTEIFPYPTQTNFGQTFALGNGGESSGGTLAGYLNKTSTSVFVRTATGVTAGQTTAANLYAIAPLGTSDAATAVGGATPGVIIGYNGSNPSASGTALADAIKAGSYQFWSYLHCLHNGLTGDKLSFYNTLTSALAASTVGNITLGDMRVERFSDGGTVFPK